MKIIPLFNAEEEEQLYLASLASGVGPESASIEATMQLDPSPGLDFVLVQAILAVVMTEAR